jgi:predicted transcriptional regulator of viral defense system
MNNADRLKILSDSGRTVFSLKNLQVLWGCHSAGTKIYAKRMTDKGLIQRIARGYYALNENFRLFELANVMISPSYISLFSSLFHFGVSFQASSIIASVGLLNYEKKAAGRTFKYFAMKEPLFFNLEGINFKENLAVAGPERGILDCLYFNLLPSIDNIDRVNKGMLWKTALYYPETVRKKLKKLVG